MYTVQINFFSQKNVYFSHKRKKINIFMFEWLNCMAYVFKSAVLFFKLAFFKRLGIC